MPRNFYRSILIAFVLLVGCARQHGRHRGERVREDAAAAVEMGEDPSAIADPEAFEEASVDSSFEPDASHAMAQAEDAGTDSSSAEDAPNDADAADADAADSADAARKPYLVFVADRDQRSVYEAFAVRADRLDQMERISPPARRSELIVYALRYVQDGKVLIAHTDAESREEPKAYAIYRADPPVVHRLGGRADQIELSANGKYVAVLEKTKAPRLFQLGATAPVELSLSTPLTASAPSVGAARLQFSPDETHFLYSAYSYFFELVTLAGPDAGRVLTVRAAKGAASDGIAEERWSADSQHIVFRSYDAETHVAATSSPLDTVPIESPEDKNCAPTAAIRHVTDSHVFVRCHSNTVVVTDLAGHSVASVPLVHALDRGNIYCGNRAVFQTPAGLVYLESRSDGLARTNLPLPGVLATLNASFALSRDCTQLAAAADDQLVRLDLDQPDLGTAPRFQRARIAPAVITPGVEFSPMGHYLRASGQLFHIGTELEQVLDVQPWGTFAPDDSAFYYTLPGPQPPLTDIHRFVLHGATATDEPVAAAQDAIGNLQLDDTGRFLAFPVAHLLQGLPNLELGGVYEQDLMQPGLAPRRVLERPVERAGTVRSMHGLPDRHAVIFETDATGGLRLYARALTDGSSTLQQNLGPDAPAVRSYLYSRDGSHLASVVSGLHEPRLVTSRVRLRNEDPDEAPRAVDASAEVKLIGFGPENEALTFFNNAVVDGNTYHVSLDQIDVRTLQRTTLVAVAKDQWISPSVGAKTGRVFYTQYEAPTLRLSLYVLEHGAREPILISTDVDPSASALQVAPSESWLTFQQEVDGKPCLTAAHAERGWKAELLNRPDQPLQPVTGYLNTPVGEVAVLSDGTHYPASPSLPQTAWGSATTPNGRTSAFLRADADGIGLYRWTFPEASPLRVATLPGYSSTWAVGALSADGRYVALSNYAEAAPAQHLYDLRGERAPLALSHMTQPTFDASSRYLALVGIDGHWGPWVLSLSSYELRQLYDPGERDSRISALLWVD